MQRAVPHIAHEVLRQVKLLREPRTHHAAEDPAIKVTPAAHGDPTVRDELHLCADALRDGDIERPAAEIIDEEQPVLLFHAHHAHHRRHGLLHERDASDARHLRRLARCRLLHLVECGGDSDDRTNGGIAAHLLRQVAVQGLEHLGGALLRRQITAEHIDVDRRFGSHHPLEELRRILWVLRRGIIGTLADVLVAAPIIAQDGRRDIVLLGAFPYAQRRTIVGTNRAVGRAKVDTDVLFHDSALRSIAVPY